MSRPSLPHRGMLLILILAIGVTACGDDDAADNVGVTVIATTTILGDIAGHVVGDAGTVITLIPVGASPHDYQTSAQQAAAIQQADLVIANGLGLEEGLSDVLESARSDGATILEIAPLVDPIPFGTMLDHEDEVNESDDHSGDGDDPHFWLDPLRDAEAARLIAAELATVAPDVDWDSRAEAYAGELEAADELIEEILSSVPTDRRKLVTNHHSFSYFAQRYGFEVIGVVIPGGSTLAEPSSAELSALVAEIQDAGVKAIFAETTESSQLADALAAEIGEDVTVVKLYTGSLGEPGSGAETLIGMLQSNATLIAQALS